MPTYRSEQLNVLDARHYTHQITDAERLDLLASQNVVTGYAGFDPTAPSLHVGSLVQIIPPPSQGRNKNKKYLIISDLAANNLRIRCFFQVGVCI